MNIYIVTDSSTYELRAELISRYFAGKGDNVTLIGTCFEHRKKRRRSDISETDSIDDTGIRHIYLDAGGYKKNISPARLWYHHRFAKKAYRQLKELIIGESLIYLLLPSVLMQPIYLPVCYSASQMPTDPHPSQD